jgi:phage FluMu gp28-like protein
LFKLRAPDLFFEKVEGFPPYAYQSVFLYDKSDRICWVSGRQCGKSTSTAIKALHLAITKPRQTIVILAPVQRQSSLIFMKIRDCINRVSGLKNYLVQESQTMLQFENESIIYCLPAGNDGAFIRGFAANMIIVDEAAQVKEAVWKAILPFLATTRGKLILISTPFGMQNFFYKASCDPSFSQHKVLSVECPLIDKSWLEAQSRLLTEIEYRQEYLCEFLSVADAYFPEELINSIIDHEWTQTFVPEVKEYYAGVDLARFGSDSSVYTIMERVGNNYRVCEIVETTKKPLTDAIGRILDLDRKWNFRKIYVDATGLGAGVTDVTHESFELQSLDMRIREKVEPITFTVENKEVMYRNLKRLMEQGRLKIPLHQKLVSQLKQLQYEFTTSHLKIHHPDEPNAHDDFPTSLALAVFHATKEGVQDFKFFIPEYEVEEEGKG